ncbi:MAG: response regulator [Chloroflexota bacterium]
MMHRFTGETDARSIGAAGNPSPNGRVLLIDYDGDLSEVMAALLENSGLEVVEHNCPEGACRCQQELLTVKPNLILVNVIESAYPSATARGWRCLQQLAPLSERMDIPIIAYTIFDDEALHYQGVDGARLGVSIWTDVSSPGDFADEITARYAPKLVA